MSLREDRDPFLEVKSLIRHRILFAQSMKSVIIVSKYFYLYISE